MKRYKTTIIIWSDFDGSRVELDDLARSKSLSEATDGDAICTRQESVLAESDDDDEADAIASFFDDDNEDDFEHDDDDDDDDIQITDAIDHHHPDDRH